MRKIAIRIALFLLAAEAVYLVLGNLALNLAFTQNFVNGIKPEKFIVNWDNAWTWYPLRVSATGIQANGQSSGQQWQVAINEASASIALLPLFAKTVNISNVSAGDITYFQRPRPGAEQDFSSIRQFFAPIEGRELLPRSEPSPVSGDNKVETRKSWDIHIENAQVHGSHEFWLYQLQAKVSGEATGNFSMQTRGGLLSLDGGAIDVQVESMVINGNREITRQGELKGKLEIAPFTRSDNRGIKVLNFLAVDANFALTTKSLEFLNPYLLSFHGMKVDGAGKVRGRAVIDHGEMKPGTRLQVEATQLDLELLDFNLEGDGEINMAVDEPGDESRLAIKFGELNVYAEKERILLLQGNGLALDAAGPTRIIPAEGQALKTSQLAVAIPSLKVPDLQAYQRFLPEKWAFRLHGGEGEMKGDAELSDNIFRANFELRSEQADIGFKEFRFASNLDIGLKVDSTSLEQGQIDVSGTHFNLGNAKLSTDDVNAKPWSATLKIEHGSISLNLDDAESDVSGAGHFVKELKDQGFGPLLAVADENLKVSGSISDLRWLNLLLNNPHGLAISGSGAIDSNVIVSSGWLQKGTRLTVAPKALGVAVLDYRAEGSGGVDMQVIKGGEFPDISLGIDVHDAQFGHKDDTEEFIENVDMSLRAVAYGFKLQDPNPRFELAMKIPTARIKDMSVYNQYLPKSSPIRILGGEADLELDIQLKPYDASGFIRLKTDGMTGLLDEQKISGNLSVDISLAGGIPANMDFDISGSSIVLDGVRVTGSEKNFRDEDWSVELDLTRARAVWKKPVQLDLDADLSMTDSMPMVSILANQRGEQDWLTQAMTVDDVQGTASLIIADDIIQIPHAFLSSDKIDVGAKAVIHEDARTGMVYVRYGILKALLETRDGKRNLDVINTEEQFRQYSTETVLATLSQVPGANSDVD